MPLPEGLTFGGSNAPYTWDRPFVVGRYGYIDPLKRITFLDDFLGDTLSTDNWLVTREADGTDQTTVAITEAAGGTVLLSLGSTANDFGNLASGLTFSTSAPGRMDVRVKVTTGADAIDNLVIGLTDAKTESNGNLCTNVVTPAIVPDDALLWIYELANGGDFWYYGTANNTTDRATATTLTVGSTYQKLSIVWKADLSVDFYINDVQRGRLTSAYRTGQVLCPIIASTHVGGTGDPIITVDYVHVSQERV